MTTREILSTVITNLNTIRLALVVDKTRNNEEVIKSFDIVGTYLLKLKDQL